MSKSYGFYKQPNLKLVISRDGMMTIKLLNKNKKNSKTYWTANSKGSKLKENRLRRKLNQIMRTGNIR